MNVRNFIVILAAVLLSSCDSFWNAPLPHDPQDARYWESEEQLAAVANTFTLSLGGKEWIDWMESMGDSAPWSTSSAYYAIGAGKVNKDQPEFNDLWIRSYRQIARVNHFLAHYQQALSVPIPLREQYAAEAYFYRAYTYWVLTTLFGDVPYIDQPLDPDSPDTYRGRDPRAEIVKTVTAELEEHYHSLPVYVEAASPAFGRVSQCTALALLSRIYLYNEMWEKAEDAAARAMDNPYYCLYTTGRPERDYADLFNFTGRASRNPDNHEVLLAYVYNNGLSEDFATRHNRSGESWRQDGPGAYTPTQSMVEAYLTADGEIWNPDPLTFYEGIFTNRDPRLTQSILSPLQSWSGGKSGDRYSYDDRLYSYPKFIDDRTGCVTPTGYYIRKYVEPSVAAYAGQDDNDVIFFRYGEVLLNYAEAKCMQGNLSQEDLDMSINLLRDRVDMVHLTLEDLPEGSDLLTEIRRERRVELFAEGHRYLDLLRWHQGEVLGQPLLGVRRDWILPVRVEDKADPILENLEWMQVGKHEYLVMDAERHFDPARHYLFPIPAAQEKLNPNLLPNNPGW